MLSLNFSPFPALSTDRLVLRQLILGDEQEIYRLRSDEQVNAFIDRPRYVSLDEAEKFILRINEAISNNDLIFWGISTKDDPKLVGTITFWNIAPPDARAEIGFELLPEYQRMGYMSEAVASVVHFGFSTMKLKLIEAFAHAENHACTQLLEKCAFTKSADSGHLHNGNEGHPVVVYSRSNPVLVRLS